MSRCIPSINPDLPIPELIKIIKHFVRDSDFLEIQSILLGHESPAKLKLEEKLRKSRRKCKALKQEKEELKKDLDDLRERKSESDALAKLYEIKFGERIMKMEGVLAKLFNVDVEDLAELVATFDKSGAEPEIVDSDPGERDLVCSPTAPTCDTESPGMESHVSEADVVVILDDDDYDISPGYTTHVSDTSSEPKDKRKATGDDSPIHLIRKMKTQVDPCDDSQTCVDSTDSDAESSSYSDGYMENLVATAQKIR